MKKRNFLIVAIVLLAMVTAVYAALPPLSPPPANQQLAIYDTSTNNFNEALCRNCHNTTFQGGVPTRHHYLIEENKINPETGLVYDCTDCHPATSSPDGYGVLMDRNCVACHNGTAFYANSIGGKVNVTRPHHNTTLAQERKCGNTTGCHGSAIDNVNDSHYIPKYNASIVTPDTSYKTYNVSSGRYWGGCEACHRANTTVTPKINDNNNTHHNALIGVTKDMPPLSGSGAGCAWCHNTTSGALNIRTCEECHSVKTIHNIQYNYTNSSGIQGYGHIGTNWDCKGCHAWYNYASAPMQGAILPDMSGVTPSVLLAGQPTVVTITGSNLLQDTYSTIVTVDGNTLRSASVTNSKIVVTVPALTIGDHIIQVVKGDAVSRFSTLTVVAKVTISSAKLTTDGVKTLTITGTGFGSKPANNAQQYVTFVHAGKTYHSDSVTSWTNTEIVANPGPSAAVGDTVTVTIPTGSGKATIEAGGVAPSSSITVTSPNGGENWKRGTTQSINWTSVGSTGDNVKIELLRGTKASIIANNVPNSGSYSWAIPSKQSIGTTYKIRITSGSNSLYTDMSDNYFQISR